MRRWRVRRRLVPKILTSASFPSRLCRYAAAGCVPECSGGAQRSWLAVEPPRDRKSVVSGTREEVRVDLGGRRIIKHQHNPQTVVSISPIEHYHTSYLLIP